MKNARMMSVAIAVGLGIGLGVLSANHAEATPQDTAATCIQVRPEARYLGLGYNHIVHVTDVCKSAAECEVSTDVNPQPQHVSVAAGAHIEVNTFIGSPARVFVPKVECKMQGQ